MATRNKKSKKKSNKNFFDKDIVGIIIIAIGIIIMISLFSTKMGIVGQGINDSCFSLMGFGGYFFPISIISIGVMYLFDRFDKLEFRNTIAIIVIFISLLVVLDGINKVDLGFIDRIKNSIILSKVNRGGGIIGSFFGFFFYKLFGTVGAYLVLSLLITICLLIVTNRKIKDIVKKTKNNSIKHKKKDNRKKHKEQLSPEVLLEIPHEEIKIHDYSKNTQVEIMKENTDSSTVKKENKNIENIDSEIKEKQIKFHNITYKIPSLNLLNSPVNQYNSNNKKEVLNNAKIIEDTMNNFGIEAIISKINVGPTITCYELSPSPGIKLSRIVSLSDNIALSLASSDIRIEAPIPGKAAVGIEVPNRIKDNVYLKEIIQSSEYKDTNSSIPLALGKDVSGKPIVSSIDKMPHLLIAGATGSGKSVCINTIIMSILYKSSPDDVKLMLIDPKVVELNVYNGIPHLLIPVVTDAKKAAFALNWAVTEMERRYKIFAKNNVRDITAYNNKIKDKKDEEKLPTVVIIIDELADLMMVAAQEIEDYICRLAQMARAAGMYLIVATQRPSVDVITGTIKANIPSRISFAVSSQVDSRTILDMSGAEKLLGKGDMLFYPSFYSKPTRIQGAFIGDNEVEKVVNFLKDENTSQYDEQIIDIIQNPKNINNLDSDELLPDAIKLVVEEGQASISLLQRRLKVGYARAARIVDEMEERGVVGGYEGSKPRKVLVSKEELTELEEEI